MFQNRNAEGAVADLEIYNGRDHKVEVPTVWSEDAKSVEGEG